MIDQLKYYDRLASVWINQHSHPFLDELMWFISSSTPFLLLIFIAVFNSNRKDGLRGMWLFFGFLLLAFALSDLVSARAFKEVFMRLRPSHNPNLADIIQLYTQPNGELYRGGLYGFVSSHAANFASLVTFIILYFKPPMKFVLLMTLTHLLVIYSRVYLGVHYVGDVVGGSLVGIACGITIWKIRSLILSKLMDSNSLQR
jgi:undecaprenyl-diphosphatase